MAQISPGTRRRRTAALAVISALVIIILGLGYVGWRNQHRYTPAQRYQHMVSAFTSGVLAMNVSDNKHALHYLLEATRLNPDEPAAWADLGLYYLRNNSADNYKSAKDALTRAHSLVPDNEQIEILFGLLSQKQGVLADAVTHYQRAVSLAPGDVKARYALLQALGQSGSGDTPEISKQWEQMAALQPDNLFIELQLAAVAAKAGDLARVRAVVQRVAPQTIAWPPDLKQQFQALRTAASGTNARDAATQAQFLINIISPADQQLVPAYQQGRSAVGADVSASSEQIGAPLERFLKLPNPPATPAAPDLQTSFTPQQITSATKPSPIAMVQSAMLTSLGPSVVEITGAQVRVAPPTGPPTTLRFPGGGTAPAPESILAADWSNDFNVDLVLAQRGLLFYQQQPNGTFLDVTAKTKLPAPVLTGAYTGAWAADIDTDGDLDIILGAAHGPPTVLRNNADGTFTPIHPFPGLTSGLQGWAWADLDNDGLPDAVVLDGQGRLSLLENRRSGVFAPWPLPAGLGAVAAVAVADVNRDGLPDVTTLGTDGVIRRISRQNDGWDVSEIARWPDAPSDGSARLLWDDMDNNGGLDLIATGSRGTQVWLSDVAGALTPLQPLDTRSISVENPATGGRLNLVGVSPAGQPVRLVNKGTKAYGWQDVRLRSQLTHDRRINAYALGSQIQVRAGLLYEEQIVAGPVTHFGLGAYPKADYIRIFWTNGTATCNVQGEFEPKANQVFDTPQRLCGSCPWLFADDGHGMKFITDLIWRSPLGLRINAQNTAGVAMTQDRVRIAGSQLAPINGSLNLSVTAELWETHFFDFFSLLAVDHPAGTDVYTDERFAIPPPPLDLRALTPPQPAAQATDDRGQDVTDIVRARDGRYLDTFGRGAFQGVTRDHFVALDLGKAPPASRGRPWLVAEGWIHPTDSSINLALSQGRHETPRDLSLEVPDSKGGWRVARPHLGFPAGKNKTVLLDLSGLFQPGEERRLRLRTNLEVFWDFLGAANELSATTLKIRRLSPTLADLRERGYSQTHQADASSPEIPDYNAIAGTSPQWVDLIGYYTRFGDVRPLVQQVDDRYVIMNAGDELRLRFPSPAPPPHGWVRDYILESNGWEKDGNFNTGFSKTVLPLPSHDRPGYNTPPRRLQDDPVYRRYPHDWQTYHTRYVTPERFQQAVRPHL